MGMFGSRLPAPKEREYQIWRSSLPAQLQNEQDYDLRGAFLSNAAAAANGHLPDTYKLPNHMTFSNESMYSTPQEPGGNWQEDNGRWSFWASPTNLAKHSAADLAAYFRQYEPDASLILPELGYRMRGK